MLQWCHLSPGSPGRRTLKRSNRLILLIGLFLAVVAFVGDEVTAETVTPGAIGSYTTE